MVARSVLEIASTCSTGIEPEPGPPSDEGIPRRPLPFPQTPTAKLDAHSKIPRLRRERGILLVGPQPLRGCIVAPGQNAASSSSMMSLSIVSSTWRVLVNSGRKFFEKKDATAILPS
jgi:hypothetical protein